MTNRRMIPDQESTMMYLAQLRRGIYPRRPKLDEEVEYLRERGADVTVKGTSLYVLWPVGRTFYD